MTLTKAKYSPLSHWSHLVTFLSPEQLSWQIHAFSWYCSSQRYDMMQGLTLFLSSRNHVCLSPQFTYKEIKDTQLHRRCFVVFLKEWFVPFWTAAHYKQISALHLHSVTWSVLTTVILQLQQALRNYTGKFHPHLSEILMSAYLWHCAFSQGVPDQSQNFDPDIPCFPLKTPEITFDLSVKKTSCSYRGCQE